MEIFDISRALSDELAPWPGDTPFHFELKWKMAEGATVNVGAINMGVHNGTHADATFHFDESGDPIDRMPLDAYVGERGRGRSDEAVRENRGELDRTRQIGIADLEEFFGVARAGAAVAAQDGSLERFESFSGLDSGDCA